MNHNKLLQMMVDLERELATLPLDTSGQWGPRHHIDEAFDWQTRVYYVLQLVFPRGNACLREFEDLRNEIRRTGATSHPSNMKGLLGILQASRRIVDGGYLGSLEATIRAESVVDLLDQANDLLESGYLVAATTTAGGALEMHLKYLCESNDLTWVGHGSISKYRGALDAERTQNGNEIVSKGDCKQAESWGDTRNAAAHNPGGFDKTRGFVELYLEGIRQFVARTS